MWKSMGFHLSKCNNFRSQPELPAFKASTRMTGLGFWANAACIWRALFRFRVCSKPRKHPKTLQKGRKKACWNAVSFRKEKAKRPIANMRLKSQQDMLLVPRSIIGQVSKVLTHLIGEEKLCTSCSDDDDDDDDDDDVSAAVKNSTFTTNPIHQSDLPNFSGSILCQNHQFAADKISASTPARRAYLLRNSSVAGRPSWTPQYRPKGSAAATSGSWNWFWGDEKLATSFCNKFSYMYPPWVPVCKIRPIIWFSSQPCFSLWFFHFKRIAGRKLDALEPSATKDAKKTGFWGWCKKSRVGTPSETSSSSMMLHQWSSKIPFFPSIEGAWIFEIFALVLPQTYFVFTFTFHWHPGRGPTPKLSPFLIRFQLTIIAGCLGFLRPTVLGPVQMYSSNPFEWF